MALMPLVGGLPVSLPSPTIVKMEERKRPAVDNADPAPPFKRQATSVNGAGKAHIDADMPWQDDLEVSMYSPMRYHDNLIRTLYKGDFFREVHADSFCAV